MLLLGLTSTRTRFNLLIYTFSLCIVRSSEAFLTIKATMKCRIPIEKRLVSVGKVKESLPSACSRGRIFHRVWMSFSSMDKARSEIKLVHGRAGT